MFKELEINGKKLSLTANAATPYRYKQVFGEDLLAYFGGKKEAEEVTMMIPKLAFVMAKQTEGVKEWNKLTFDAFAEWAEGFDALDLTGGDAAGKILSVYTANAREFSKAKKNQG